MDITNMSEEEQLRLAMELSMGGPAPAAAPAASEASRLPLPTDRRRPRAFPKKDAQDVLPDPATVASAGSAKRKRLADGPRAASTGAAVPLPEGDVSELLRFLFGDKPEAKGDVERWFNVGFQFSDRPGAEWGLHQRHGGPCGVFAPVQAFLVKHLLFRTAAEEDQSPEAQRRREQPLTVSGTEEGDARSVLLAHSLASILFCAAPSSSYVICELSPRAPGDDEASTCAAAVAAGNGGSAVAATVHRVGTAAEAQQLLEEASDSWLSGPRGVLSFVSSVLLSRKLAVVKEDMDDPCTPLIGRFGHCSQELVNLMLIGEATSNVFDGTKWLGDDPSSGFTLKGVDGDRIGAPAVGFLSELEPMRYLCVGQLYKYPEFPLWVLGSPTHYTLLFSTRRADSQLSAEAQLDQRARRAFTENALDEGGLAMASGLGRMLESLGIGADRLSQAQSELVHEDIILQEDFLSWARRQFGVSSSGTTSSNRLKLFLYDGQDPPGPSLRAVMLEQSDIDPSLAGGSGGDSLSATLQTRWPNAIVDLMPAAGAEGGSTAL